MITGILSVQTPPSKSIYRHNKNVVRENNNCVNDNSKNNTVKISSQTLQAYSGVNFTGRGKTNYLWMQTIAGYIPLVIAAGLDLTKSVTVPALPGLICEDSDWTDVNMEGVYIKNSKLKNSKFNNTNMNRVELHDSDLSGSQFNGVQAKQGRFSHSNFYNVTMKDSEFPQANFQKADFKWVTIKNSNFNNANFLGADLSNVWSIDEDSIFQGAIYDRDTKFPSGFDPESKGMIKLKEGGDMSVLEGDIKRVFSRVTIKPYKEEYPYSLSNADYSGSDMQEGKFDSVEFISSNFEDTIARGAIFIDCDFSKCKFNEKSDFEGASFNNSVFYDTKFNGANLKRCNLIGADLSETDFAELPDEKIAGSFYDVSTSFPEGYKPEEHGLIPLNKKADLSNCNFSHMKVRNTLSGEQYIFSGSNLRRADFSGAELGSCDFSAAKLHDACFKEAKMQGANFEDAVLYNANLIGGDFRNANFRNADLRWAKLVDANLDGADFTGAKYVKNATEFPKNFNPKAHGMVEVPLKLA